MQQIERGDSLYNKIDKKIYLVLQVDYNEDYILLSDIHNKQWVISSNANTLSNFQLIKDND